MVNTTDPKLKRSTTGTIIRKRELMYVFDRSGRAHENDHTNVGDELGEINNIRNAQFIKQTCGKCPIVKLAF